MWKVYYGDGTTFSSKDGPPDQAPAANVQVIVQSSAEHGWQALSNSHYYIWRDERWWMVDMQGFGLFDYLLQPGWKRVLFGRTLPNEDFTRIWQQVASDPEMVEKTGFDKRERQPWAQQ